MSLEHKAVKASQIVMGLEESHLIQCGHGMLHKDVVTPFSQLHTDALNEGFDLQPISAFRSFERQLTIWNAKANGERPVLDNEGKELNIQQLSEEQIMFAILRWSALPGASRHHWGTDFDVVDANAITQGYKVQLTVAETEDGGPFASMHNWLNDYLKQQQLFFRPYELDTGGVAPEPWHLSYAPLAREIQQQLSIDNLVSQLEQSNLALKEVVLANIEQIFEQFIWVEWSKYPVCSEQAI